jgi:DNA cross-link repair 1C protein
LTATIDQIHVDRYKYDIYTHLSDTNFRSMFTRNPNATRFHACERHNRCDEVEVDDPPDAAITGMYGSTSRTGKRVVYVNPVRMEPKKWEQYLAETKWKLETGDEEVNNLVRRPFLSAPFSTQFPT